MKRRPSILFDTSSVSAWLREAPWYMAGHEALLRECGGDAYACISSVTLQELLVWTRVEPVLAVIAERFVVLEHASPASDLAAQVQRLVRPVGQRGGAHRDNVDRWQRDGAILGTALAHEVDFIVASDGHFRPYRDELRLANVRLILPPPPAKKT